GEQCVRLERHEATHRALYQSRAEPEDLEQGHGQVPTSTGRRARGAVPSQAEELKEFDPLAEAAPHHGRALDHLPHDLGDLARSEEEGAVKLLLHLEDVSVREVRVLERGDLEAVLRDELPRLVAQPALALGLVVQISSR